MAQIGEQYTMMDEVSGSGCERYFQTVSSPFFADWRKFDSHGLFQRH